MIMPCSRPQSTRQEEEGRGAEVGRIVSASEEEEGREAKIREKIPMILFPFFPDFFFFTRLVTPEIMLLLQRRPTQGSQMRSKAEWPRSPSFGTTPRQRHLATLRCGFLLVFFWFSFGFLRFSSVFFWFSFGFLRFETLGKP